MLSWCLKTWTDRIGSYAKQFPNNYVGWDQECSTVAQYDRVLNMSYLCQIQELIKLSTLVLWDPWGSWNTAKFVFYTFTIRGKYNRG